MLVVTLVAEKHRPFAVQTDVTLSRCILKSDLTPLSSDIVRNLRHVFGSSIRSSASVQGNERVVRMHAWYLAHRLVLRGNSQWIYIPVSKPTCT
jgi:hypothetical protein